MFPRQQNIFFASNKTSYVGMYAGRTWLMNLEMSFKMYEFHLKFNIKDVITVKSAYYSVCVEIKSWEENETSEGWKYFETCKPQGITHFLVPENLEYWPVHSEKGLL